MLHRRISMPALAVSVLFACGAPPSPSSGANVITPADSAVAPVAPVAAAASSLPHATQDAGVAALTRGRVVDVGAGWQHACALLDDTTVRCWGRGDQGQIGDGMGENRRRPTTVIGAEDVMRGATGKALAPLRGVVSLGVGQEHACAVLDDGTVRCWGKSSNGELGASGVSGWSPHTVRGVSGAVEVTSGHYYNCARIKDGSVRCWGSVPMGRRKNPPTKLASAVETIGNVTTAVQLVAGEDSACAKLADGGVACWSASGFGEGAPKVAKAERTIPFVDRGDRDHCTLDEAGRAVCTGSHPVTIDGVRKVATGGTVSCVLLVSGELRCFGSTEYGQLGEGSGRVRSTPTRVIDLDRADALWAGSASCARESTGVVKCWGGSSDYVLGVPGPPYYAAAPMAVDAIRGATQVSIPDLIGCALRADATVACWNLESKGVPHAVSGITDVRELTASQQQVCVRHEDGTARCWGSALGMLGRGGVVREGDTGPYAPAKVKGVTGIAQISGGVYSTCARLTSGKVRCWGSPGYLGDGSRPSQSYTTTATTVKGITDATYLSVASTGMGACVIKRDRTLACWGHETYGEFGDWMTEQEGVDHPVPVATRGIANALSVAVGDGNTCVLIDGGGVQCFGGNQWGELGDGTTQVRVRPQPVPGMTDVVQIVAHQNLMCARKADGSVWCWGRGDFGGVGDGSPNERPQPYPVRFD